MSGSARRLRSLSRGRKVAVVGLVSALCAGGLGFGLSLGTFASATPMLEMSSTATGVTCTSGYSTAPVCTGLAATNIVSLSAENLTPGALGSIEQCNNDASQPIIYYLGTSIPISCTPVSPTTIGTSGVLAGNKAVKGGTLATPAATGPPAPGSPSCTATQQTNGTTTTSQIPNCTTSGNATTDAANFPCPPTAAQRAIGDTCIFAIGDNAGDHAVGTILWAGETVPTQASSQATLASSQITDKATVSSGNIYTGSPSGSVDFYVCQTSTSSTLTPGTCAASGTPQDTETLTASGDNETSTATSAAFTPTSNGTWCFSFAYAGGSYFDASASNTSSSNQDNNECVLVSSSGTTSTTSTSTTSTTSTSTTSTTSTSTTSTTSTSTTSTTSTSTTSTTTTTQPTTTTTSTQPTTTTSTQPTTTTTSTQPTTTTTSTQPTTTTTTTTTGPPPLTGPYALYCPGTPVGDVALNNVTTSAGISPASPSAGDPFSLTNYQTVVNIPQALAEAAASIQPNLTGSANTQIDATGATPAETPQGPFDFDVPIPNPVPADGVMLTLPSPATTVTGFTATGSNIVIQEDSTASLTLEVAGTPLTLTCTAYPNSSVPVSGIVTSPPSGNPIAPVIAVAGSPTSPTSLSYTGATVATNGQGLAASGSLTSGGSGVPGESVEFTLGSGSTAQSCSGTTDSSGVASCSISSVLQAVGPVNITASFLGDSQFAPASDSATVTVSAPTPAPTTLTVGSASGPQGQAASVSATLEVTSSSAPVSGASIQLTLNSTETCSGTTDGAGVATCMITPGEGAGSYPLDASFAGNSTDAASNGSNTFVVTTTGGISGMLDDLAQAVTGVGPGQSLLAKVQAAQLGYGTGNVNGACGVLGGFVNEVGAQSGKKLSTDQAMALATEAETILQALSC